MICRERDELDRMRACFGGLAADKAGIAQLVEQLTCNQ